MTLTLLLLLAPTAAADWTDDVAAAVAACASDPAPCDVVADLHLRATRAGHLMAQDPRITDPAVLPVLIDRLVVEPDPAKRVGVADAVAQAMTAATGPRWYAAWGELAATHPDPAVRSTLITSLRRAPMDAAGPGLRAALKHADPATRAEAASTMGGQLEATAFVPDLVAAAADPDALVRAKVLRALGWVVAPAANGAQVADPAALAVLRSGRTDADPGVRFEAEQAIAKLGD